MAALKSSELKYGTPTITVAGAHRLTATRIEIPATKEVESGTVELNLAKLGLTGEQVLGTPASAGQGLLGETGEAVAATTALPVMCWCTNLVEAKTDAEAAKEVKEGYLTQVSLVKEKLIVRIFGVTTAGDGKPINEAKTATKLTFTAAQAFTVFVVGR